MSDELYEVSLSGRIAAGESLDEVKARVAKMFNASESKLELLFSGSRVVIKKNIDLPTATKYQDALKRAGAVADVNLMSTAAAVSANTQPHPEIPPTPPKPAVAETAPVAREPRLKGESESEVAPPPNTDPLGISAAQIEDLSVTVAPAGSVILDKPKEIPEPQFDLSEFAVAPVGSVLSTPKKEADPPPPDITGLSLAE